MATIFRDDGHGLLAAGGFPPHPARFEQSGYDLAALLAVDARACTEWAA